MSNWSMSFGPRLVEQEPEVREAAAEIERILIALEAKLGRDVDSICIAHESSAQFGDTCRAVRGVSIEMTKVVVRSWRKATA